MASPRAPSKEVREWFDIDRDRFKIALCFEQVLKSGDFVLNKLLNRSTNFSEPFERVSNALSASQSVEIHRIPFEQASCLSRAGR